MAGPPTPSQVSPGVIDVAHDARGHTMVTDQTGTRDIGIPNTRGNAAIAYLTTSGVQTTPQGTQLAVIQGTADIASLKVLFPTGAQQGDYFKVNTNVSITALMMADPSGATVLDGFGTPLGVLPISAYGAQVFLFNGLNWMLAQKAALQGPKGDAGPAGAASTVPGPKGDTGAAGPSGTANLTWLPIGKASVTGATTATIALLNIGNQSPIILTVPGVLLGDQVDVAFAGAPPTGLAIIGRGDVTAANTVRVVLATTQSISLALGTQIPFIVYWSR